MRALTLLAIALASAPGAAWAFRDQALFVEPAMGGGGGGSFFTGSPASRGYDCSICHVEAPGRIALRVAADPPTLAQSWSPGTTYRITVRIEGEGGQQSAVVAEVVDAEGSPAGNLEPTDSNVARPADGNVVFGGGSGQASWTFDWVAPAAGAGSLELYLAAVAGDGAGASSGSDPYRDDVAVTRLSLVEATAPPSNGNHTAEFGAGGCRVAGRGPTTLTWGLLVLLIRGRPRSRSA